MDDYSNLRNPLSTQQYEPTSQLSVASSSGPESQQHIPRRSPPHSTPILHPPIHSISPHTQPGLTNADIKLAPTTVPSLVQSAQGMPNNNLDIIPLSYSIQQNNGRDRGLEYQVPPPPSTFASDLHTLSVNKWAHQCQPLSPLRHPYPKKPQSVPRNVLRIPEPKVAIRVSRNGKYGSQLSTREVFNKLFSEYSGRAYMADDYQNPITSEIFRDSLSFARYLLYTEFKLGSEKGKLTFSSIRKSNARYIELVKRKLEDRHPVFKKAVAGWAAERLFKEALRRDRFCDGPGSKRLNHLSKTNKRRRRKLKGRKREMEKRKSKGRRGHSCGEDFDLSDDSVQYETNESSEEDDGYNDRRRRKRKSKEHSRGRVTFLEC